MRHESVERLNGADSTQRISQSNGRIVHQDPLHPALRRRLLDVFYR